MTHVRESLLKTSHLVSAETACSLTFENSLTRDGCLGEPPSFGGAQLGTPRTAETVTPPRSCMTLNRTVTPSRQFTGESYRSRNLRGHFRQRAYEFLTNAPHAPKAIRRAALAYQAFTTLLIVALFVLESRSMSADKMVLYNQILNIAAVLFSIEYVLRIHSCLEGSRGRHPTMFLRCRTRCLNLFHPIMVLDLFCIVSLIADLAISSDHGSVYRDFGWIRLFRLVNIFRVERNFRVFRPVLHVIWQKRNELTSTLGIAGVLLLVSSAIMYYIESPHNEEFPNILSSMWWATAALTTVGYGDACPKTAAGRFVGAIVAFVGMAFFALPAGIVASAFQEALFEGDAQDTEEQVNESRDGGFGGVSSVLSNTQTENQQHTRRPGLVRLAHLEARFEKHQTLVASRLDELQASVAAMSCGQRQVLELLQQLEASSQQNVRT